MRREQARHLIDRALPPDQAVQRRGQRGARRVPRRRGGRCVEQRILPQHGLMNGDHLGTRVGTQLLTEPPPQLLEALQRLALPPRAVQRLQLEGPQPFAQRVPGHQTGQLGQQRVVLAQREARVGAFLPGGQPLLLQMHDRRAGEGRVREIGVRRSPPQLQRLVQQRRTEPRVGPAGPDLRQQLREPHRVDLRVGQPQRVTGGPRHHQVPAAGLGRRERPAQL